ncbi:MAG TPA: hypothetical protein VK735_15740 [Pseudonocardia sp.]|uniref:hypothetical protein n=1 Tax=Pseudonocardia sp. TaxID=60912 RepID=UPI002CD1FB52|nr:hypothetical protein [Pseudonocardia sp.]HTF48897.1 hypothetical protein [Pseudonocardia sp.]
MTPPDAESTLDSLRPRANQVNSTPRWLNGALTGLVLTSAIVAALDHQGQSPNPGDAIAWIFITLATTGLVRSYASFVAGHGQRGIGPQNFLRTLILEWSLIAAGLPAAIILLVSVAASYPLLGAVRTVLSANVLILLGLGAFGARKAGYRPFQAAALGIADAAFGLLVIAANALLK